MSNKLSGTLTLRLPSGDNRFKAFFNVGESGFATEEYVKQLIVESEKKKEGEYVKKIDIQDTLTSIDADKPLSAQQGKILKELLDAKVIEAGAVPMDSKPTEGNINNVVTSDGLAKEFNKYNTEIVLGGVYDISAHNNGAVFESLQDLLSSSNLSTLIPISVRHGGMTIRFIQGSEQTSDNKYVQYRLMSDTFNTTIDNWQGIDGTISDNSNNLITSGGVKDAINETGLKAGIPVNINVSTLQKHKYIISSIETWYLTKKACHSVVPLNNVTKVVIKPSIKANYAFLTKDYTPPTDTSFPTYIVPNTHRKVATENVNNEISVPKDAAYLYFPVVDGADEEITWEVTLINDGIIEKLNKQVGLGIVKEEVVNNNDFTLNMGYLYATNINQKATVTLSSRTRYSDPIAVLIGDIVEVESQGTEIACIATTDANGSIYIAKAISNNGDSIVTYTYEVEEDGYIVISSRTAALKGRVLRPKVPKIVNDLYKTIKIGGEIDVTSKFSKHSDQKYGTIGSAIQTYPTSVWHNIKVSKSILPSGRFKTVVPIEANPSSIVQYVDSNDIVVSIEGTNLKEGDVYEGDINFPEGATDVYINGVEDLIKVYSGSGEPVYEKKCIVGDSYNLKTENKILVDAVNEIVSLYPIKPFDVSNSFYFGYGQAYGFVGNTIIISSNTEWRHIRITNADNISSVKLISSNNASSLIQYVDDNDNIISLDLIHPINETLYEKEISFPVGATAVYVSSFSNTPILLRKDNIRNQILSSSTPSFRFRVLSWNIGHYNKGNGTSSGITEETYESEKMAFRKVFNNYAADIVGLCEYSSIFYGEETATDAILNQYKYSYIAPTESGYIGTALYSNFKLIKLEEITLPSSYKAYEGHFTANGKDIIICMAHLPWGSQETNVSAINMLITRYKYLPNVIIMGDFNWHAGHEEENAALFTKAGYKLANWGYLGKILTSYNNVICSNYLDNIVVKGGSILHTEVLQNTPDGKDPDAPIINDEALWDAVNLSDHFPIICDIVF